MLQIYLSVINIASVKYIPKKLMIYNLQAHVLFQYKITLKLKLTQTNNSLKKWICLLIQNSNFFKPFEMLNIHGLNTYYYINLKESMCICGERIL